MQRYSLLMASTNIQTLFNSLSIRYLRQNKPLFRCDNTAPCVTSKRDVLTHSNKPKTHPLSICKRLIVSISNNVQSSFLPRKFTHF